MHCAHYNAKLVLHKVIKIINTRPKKEPSTKRMRANNFQKVPNLHPSSLFAQRLNLCRHVVFLSITDERYVQKRRNGACEAFHDAGAHVPKKLLQRIESDQEDRQPPCLFHELRHTSNLTVTIVMAVLVLVHFQNDDAVHQNPYKIGTAAVRATGKGLIVVRKPVILTFIESEQNHQIYPGPRAPGLQFDRSQSVYQFSASRIYHARRASR